MSWMSSSGRTVRLERGDITKVRADAVVNAANSQLAVGGGVCGAIHRAGGPTIAAECAAYVREHRPVPTGDAALTGAGQLKARLVVHAVGPVWRGGGQGEAEALTSAYKRSVQLADEAGAMSVAFPSISTGIYGYPVAAAAPVALKAVAAALERAEHVGDVSFVLFDETTHATYREALELIER